MDRHRGHLFTCSTFAQKQNRSTCRRHFANESENPLHLGTGPEHFLENVRPYFLLHLAVFSFQVHDVDAALEDEF